MSELLPCPFCGERPGRRTFHTESLFSHDQVERLSISCTECDCALVEGEDHAEVRERWNRRPSAHDTTERQPEPRETVTPSITKELTGQGVEGAFTPGPWRALCLKKYTRVTRDSTGAGDTTGNVQICHIAGPEEDDIRKWNGARWEADARLIAAAPDQHMVLLDAPIVSKFCMKDGFDENGFFAAYDAWSERKRAAISKVTGSSVAGAEVAAPSGVKSDKLEGH